MKRFFISSFTILFILGSLFFVSAQSINYVCPNCNHYSGDGTYNLSGGDSVKLDNGWTIDLSMMPKKVNTESSSTVVGPGGIRTSTSNVPAGGSSLIVNVYFNLYDSNNNLIVANESPVTWGGFSGFTFDNSNSSGDGTLYYEAPEGSFINLKDAAKFGDENARVSIKFVNYSENSSGDTFVTLTLSSVNEPYVNPQVYCSSIPAWDIWGMGYKNESSICSLGEICLGDIPSALNKPSMKIPTTNQICCLSECTTPGSSDEFKFDIENHFPTTIPEKQENNVINAKCMNKGDSAESCIYYENGTSYCLPQSDNCLIYESSLARVGSYPSSMNVTCPKIEGQIVCFLHFNENISYPFYCGSSSSGCPPENNVSIVSCTENYGGSASGYYPTNASEFVILYQGKTYKFINPTYKCGAYVSQNFIQQVLSFFRNLFGLH